MEGKTKLLHHLPPPPDVLAGLLDDYFECLERMLSDETVDPIVCATIAKIALNTLHPMVDGNGRVQRFLFQFVLYKFGFLPRLNVPVAVIMTQDRTGYEVLQQKHVDQIMAGIAYVMTKNEEGDVWQHLRTNENVTSLYRYQDFTFATSSMIKLLRSTLPVISGQAFVLQRFDWRMEELLKSDSLLSPQVAARFAKVYKQDGSGMSLLKLAQLFFVDGWKIGFRRALSVCLAAKHPEEIFGLDRLKQRWVERKSRGAHQHWIMRSGQQLASSAGATGRVRWVGLSLEKFGLSLEALRRALAVAQPGDTVMAMYYPPPSSFSYDSSIEVPGHSLAQDVLRLRDEVLSRTQSVVDSLLRDGVEFQTFIGNVRNSPAYQLCEDARFSEASPYRIYVGYNADEHRRTFTDFMVRNAPCDLVLVKRRQVVRDGYKTRWVGISRRNFSKSVHALTQALNHSRPGDTVTAVHYPSGFGREGASLVQAHSFAEPLADETDEPSGEHEFLARLRSAAEAHGKADVRFNIEVREATLTPHRQMIADVEASPPGVPEVIYVAYSRRNRDRDRLVEPNKLHYVAEHVLWNAPCNVVLVR